MTNAQPRIKPGIPTGGQYSTFSHGEPGIALDESPAPLDMNEQRRAARHAALEAQGYVEPVAARATDNPESTAHRRQWWDTHFTNAEYGAADHRTGRLSGYPQMPDDNTPGLTPGRALSGRRRTHRMAYSGAGVTLRMPSATAIKRYEKESNGRTFDVPVSAVNADGGTITGWVRVTRSGKEWNTTGLGFSGNADAQVGEAVSAILESRRPSRALHEVGDLLAHREAREASRGVPFVKVPSGWIDSVGYDKHSGIMAMRTNTKRLYGYEVPEETYVDVATASSPGSVYNKRVKGNPRMEIESCGQCGSFYNVQNAHSCRSRTTPRPALAPEHSSAARRRAADVTDRGR